MPNIHLTALVDPCAELADDVEVGAFTLIGPHVVIGEGSRIASHVVIDGHTTIGAQNKIHSFCAIGSTPQDKKYQGEETRLEIGDRNTFFQSMTVSLGTAQDKGVTRIGHDNWFMAYAHIAHDCEVGNHTTFANSATLGGHVKVEDYAILGGLVAVHQFCVIGEHVIAGGGSMITRNVPPYVMVAGNHAVPAGVNSEGLRRRGFSSEEIMAVRRAYKMLYREGLGLNEAREKIAEEARKFSVLDLMVRFLEIEGRGIVR